MNIYHITRKDDKRSGQYVEAVIVAETEHRARAQAQAKFNQYNADREFPSNELVNCEMLGISTLPPVEKIVTYTYVPSSGATA